MSAAPPQERLTLSLLMKDEAGVLTRIAGLFSRRGYNILSLAVGSSEQPGLSRMTVVISCEPDDIDQIKKQLEKLVDVLSVDCLNEVPFVDRELLMLKVKADSQTRTEIAQIVDLFRGRVVDVSEKSLIVEVTGDQGKLKAILELLQRFEILTLCRTGQIAVMRGDL